MLTKVSCKRFRERTVNFHPGLNVILGDSEGSNSIGKSTMLMIVDFAFGGDDLIEKMSDVVKNVGHHHYDFVFDFDGCKHLFRRTTKDPGTIQRQSTGSNPGQPMTVTEYREWLRERYNLAPTGLSFRGAIGPYFRVWKKDNNNVETPLHVSPKETNAKVLDRLTRLFGEHRTVERLDARQKEKEKERKALRAAKAEKVIPAITKAEYSNNHERLRAIDDEIQEIRAHLDRFTMNINEIVNREVLEIRERKDRLLASRLYLSTRKMRIERNLSGVGRSARRQLESLLEIFPDANQKRLESVEAFHNGITSILRNELRDAQTEIAEQLTANAAELETLDAQLDERLRSTTAPAVIIDRLVKISTEGYEKRQQNEIYDRSAETATEAKRLTLELAAARTAALTVVAEKVNSRLDHLSRIILEEGRRSPQLKIRPDGASYELTSELDKGTGTAYLGLLLLDLIILELTPLPAIIEDSFLFSNVENRTLDRLFMRYSFMGNHGHKQIFIACDRAQDHSPATIALLTHYAALELSSSAVLFDTNWRNTSS